MKYIVYHILSRVLIFLTLLSGLILGVFGIVSAKDTLELLISGSLLLSNAAILTLISELSFMLTEREILSGRKNTNFLGH
jgi:hypothetical protein